MQPQPRLSSLDIKIYKVLFKQSQAVTSTIIAREVGIRPQSVYRHLEKLNKLGFIIIHVGEPNYYEALSELTSMENYLISHEVWLNQFFSKIQGSQQNKQLDGKFLRGQKELISALIKDIRKSQYRIDLSYRNKKLSEALKSAKKKVRVKIVKNNTTGFCLIDDSIVYLFPNLIDSAPDLAVRFNEPSLVNVFRQLLLI